MNLDISADLFQRFHALSVGKQKDYHLGGSDKISDIQKVEKNRKFTDEEYQRRSRSFRWLLWFRHSLCIRPSDSIQVMAV